MSFLLKPGSLKSSVGVLALGLIIAGCRSGEDTTGDAPKDDGGLAEAGPRGEPCSRLTTLCQDGETCDGAPDCASGLCRTDICQSVVPADGIKNGDETDVDCGGTKAPACPVDKGCAVAADCTSGVCTGNRCQAPSPTDGVKNGDETGKDCGGTKAPKCAVGEGCLADADCDKVKCDTVQKKCSPPSHTDGLKNGDETGLDCGGPTPAVARCAPGQGCTATSDCANVLCDVAGATCKQPASDDLLKNGTETDVDCGGGAPTNASACKPGLGCAAAADCTTSACNFAKKCAEAKSCVVEMGGTTCGAGEVGKAGAVHEDCCKSIPLPGNPTVRVDKYEITAGRMREFIRAVNNDVQTWVVNNRGLTAQIPDNMVQYLPTDLKTPAHDVLRCDSTGNNCNPESAQFGVLQHLGNNVFMPDRPCANCGQGCYIGAAVGGNGHPTYYWDDKTQTDEFGSLHRVASQAELDVKSLNCTPQLLFAAFCAWDGGRLPTQPELGGTAGAWGPDPMPFSATATAWMDTVAGNDARRIGYPFTQQDSCNPDKCFTVPMFEAGAGNTIIWHPEAATLNTTNFNPFPGSPGVFTARYAFPVPKNAANVDIPDTNDQAYAIAAPGRMRHDFHFVGPGADDGYYDVAANLLEATATDTGNDNAKHNGWPTAAWTGGSFEGHEIHRSDFNMSVLTKYGKQGARCAR